MNQEILRRGRTVSGMKCTKKCAVRAKLLPQQFQFVHDNFNLLFWLICQAKGKLEEVFKARFLDFVNAFLSCLSSQNYIAKSGTIDVNQHVSFWLLNEKFVDRGF